MKALIDHVSNAHNSTSETRKYTPETREIVVLGRRITPFRHEWTCSVSNFVRKITTSMKAFIDRTSKARNYTSETREHTSERRNHTSRTRVNTSAGHGLASVRRPLVPIRHKSMSPLIDRAAWHHESMHEDDEDAATEASVVLRETRLPAVLDADTLIAIVRVLQERIPGFQCLSHAEERAMVRASNLDPEMIEGGILAASVADGVQAWTKMTAEELRQLDDQIRDTDRVEQVLAVLLRGVAGANRKLKHRRGKAILRIYKYLGLMLRGRVIPEHTHLRPYYERMRAAYMKNRKRRKQDG